MSSGNPVDPFFGTPAAGSPVQDDMEVDLEGVNGEVKNFDAAPPGTYPCFLAEGNYKLSKSDNKMIEWIWEVEQGHPLAGRKFWSFTVFTEKSQGINRLKQLLMRVAPQTDMKKFHLENSPPTLVGVRARVKVGVQMYQGEKTNRVKDILPPEVQGQEWFGANGQPQPPKAG